MESRVSHTRWLRPGLTGMSLVLPILVATVFAQRPVRGQTSDLGVWGEDHVGRPLPLYMTGDECLFCHRDVGENWQGNWHNTGMRNVHLLPADLQAVLASPEAASFAPETTYTLGGRIRVRFLKPNDKYGQFAMHGVSWDPRTLEFADVDAGWEPDVFAKNCAGCHTTAVETEIHAFAAPSLDCFVCHGDTPPGHQNEPSLALFAESAELDPRVEMSICGSCHLRGGTSRSTGLPYPNQFVPGDNLFRDFQIELGPDATADMTPGDAHIFTNVRDVLIFGKQDLTCITCHDIHGESSRKHRVLRRLDRAEYCAICHDKGDDYRSFIEYERHSEVCRY